MRRLLVSVLATCSVLATPAIAGPFEKTKYKYYTINGSSAPAIYSAMIARGPDVNGVNAYASTSATSSQDGRLVAQGKSCRVDGYNFSINFTINLPKLKNESALTGQTAAKWSQFKSFLKVHEERHRSIWLGCARNLEAQVKALRTPNCKAFDRQAAQLWKKMRASCDKQHASFDASEQNRLIKHPFVKMVLSQRSTSTKGLKIKKP
jgi:predicted secreted Zn-dependent protease